MNLKVEVEVRTKLATSQGKRDFRRLMDRGIKELAQLGEEKLAERFRIRPAGVFLTVAQAGRANASKGFYASNIARKPTTRGFVLHDSRVVYGEWLEDGGTRGTRFKGYHVWRNTTDWLRKQVKPVARRIVRKFIQGLR